MEDLKAQEPMGKETYIFAIQDDKAQAYGYLHLFDTESLALRGFSDAVNDPQGPFVKHPEDFRLFRIGRINLRTGAIVPESPVRIGIGSDCVAVKK